MQFEVKEFTDNDAQLYLTVALSRIESEVLGAPDTSKAVVPEYLFSNSRINLSILFENVNVEDVRFLKYVPDGFLNEEQKETKEKALSKQAKEYAEYGNKNLTNT